MKAHRLWTASLMVCAALLFAGCSGCGGKADESGIINVSVQADPVEGREPLTVAFTALVQGGEEPFTYEWDFGDDDGTSTDESPTYTYESDGVFTASVTVTDANQSARTGSIEITVMPDSQPMVEIFADPDLGMEPLTVVFTSQVMGGDGDIGYDWDFGDGEGSNMPEPSHTFDAAGIYDVTLTVMDEDGDAASDTVQITVETDGLPTATVTADPTEGQAPLAVSFTCTAAGGNEPMEYNWDFGDGSTSSVADPTYTYTLYGTYYAACTVTDADGDRSTDGIRITAAEDLLLTARASASPAAALTGQTVQFTGAATGGDAPLSYAWDFGDGETSDLQNPAHVYDSVGTYLAVFTVTDSDGDMASDAVTVSVGSDEVPAAAASGTPMSGPYPLTVAFTCGVAGGNPPYTFEWDFGDGASSTVQNLSHTYTDAGSYDATCTVTDVDGDTGNSMVTIEVTTPNSPPEAVAEMLGDTSLCAVTNRTLVQLTAASSSDPDGDPLTYQWHLLSVPPGSTATLSNPTLMNPTFRPDVDSTDASELYLVRLTVSDGHGGLDTAEIAIESRSASMLEYVSGSGQTGEVGSRLPDPLVVRVMNDCSLVGGLLPDVADLEVEGELVEWRSGAVTIGSSMTMSDENGEARTNVTLGTSVGSATVTAFLTVDSSASVTFNLTAAAGPPAIILMQPPADTQVNGPMALVITITDRYGNPVTDENVTFDLTALSPSGNAALNTSTGPMTDTYTTSSGSVTVQVYDSTAETVTFHIDSWDLPEILHAGGMANLFFDNMTDDEDNLFRHSADYYGFDEWERGSPTYGPSGAHSSPDVWATDLDGVYGAGTSDYRTYLYRDFWSILREPCLASSPLVRLSFYQWYDIDNDGDCPEGGLAWVSRSTYSTRFIPDGGYDAYHCYQGYGFAGTSGGWEKATFNITGSVCSTSQIYWLLFLDTGVAERAGWYIDDVSIDAFTDNVSGIFLPGPPVSGTIAVRNNGVAGCDTFPGRVAIEAQDAYGNPAAHGQVRLSTSGNTGTVTFLEAETGTLLSAPGNPVNVELDAGGEAIVTLSDDTDEGPFQVILTTGTATTSALITFAELLPGELGFCDDGMDNDCDMARDCADPDCDMDPICLMTCWDVDLGSATGLVASDDTCMIPGNDLVPPYPLMCGPKPGAGQSQEIAFFWTAPADGIYSFDLCSAGYDSTLYVLDPLCLLQLACNDDGCGLGSRIDLDVMAGQEVVVVVDGTGPECGPFDLIIDVSSSTPGESCLFPDEPLEIPPPYGEYMDDICTWSNDMPPSCIPRDGPDMAFRIFHDDPFLTGMFMVCIDDMMFDGEVVVYEGEDCSGPIMECWPRFAPDPPDCFPVFGPPDWYTIVVESTAFSCGPFAISTMPM